MPLKSFPPRGSVLLATGCALVAPPFYNSRALDNVLGFIVVGFGIGLISIGIKRLCASPGASNGKELASLDGKTTSQDAAAPPYSLLSRLFVVLGHLSVFVTIAGAAYVLFSSPQGMPVSIGVLFGLLVAAGFYVLAGLAKT